MRGQRHLDWLGLTPEPERELPAAVAVLRASLGAAPRPPAGPAELATAERRRVERLVLRGSRHSWLRYLAEATRLVTAVTAQLHEAGTGNGRADADAEVDADADADTNAHAGAYTHADADAYAVKNVDTTASTTAALLAAEVILDHHRMLIGLPGAGYGRTAGDRAALENALRLLRTRSRSAGSAPTALTGDGR
ncbi:hypothetical protein [Streptomyces sp. NPDC051921]|uniref:hypothetical protein n=1 Tax=Streptomyces sp. NPDC051921 TaxID=3155806 RepID=UPI003430E5B2